MGRMGKRELQGSPLAARRATLRFALALILALLTFGAGASTALAAFPTVKLLDSFERAKIEEPPSRGGESGAAGEWAMPVWFTGSGDFEKNDGGFRSGAESAGEYGAYWHPVQFESPAVRLELAKEPASEGRFGLWTCISNPESATEYSGYRVLFTVTTTEHYNVTITRYDHGVANELTKAEGVHLAAKEHIGLTVSGGKVSAWVEGTIVLEVPDSTYAKGYVAFFGAGTAQRLKNFEAGGAPTVTSIAPTAGPSAGGTPVTITGTGFLTGATVKIGTEASEVVVRSETEITAKTAATTPGSDEVVVTDEYGSSKGGPKAQFKYVAPPTVLSESSSGLTQGAASLGAMVNPNGGEVTECKFEYGPSEKVGAGEIYEKSAPCSPPTITGNSAASVTATLAGLGADTTYSFRLSAVSVGGTSRGAPETFTTLPNAPTVQTGQATTISQSTATLNATVNLNGGTAGECKFEYGSTEAYGSSVACTPSAVAGSSPVAVTASLGGLGSGSTYHFRISATNIGGTSTGADVSFVTGTPTPITPIVIAPPPKPAPKPAPLPNSNFALPTSAVVNGKNGATTFQVTLNGAGTFNWLLSFQNGKFGAFASSSAKCRAGQLKLAGKCRPSVIVFGKGSERVGAAGVVTFTVKPSASASKALAAALKQNKGLPVKLVLTFQSALGGPPVSHGGSLTIKLKKVKSARKHA